MSDARKLAYVSRVLQMDPRKQAAELLAARHAFLHPDASMDATLVDETGLSPRQRDRQELAELRAAFWTLDAASLSQRLARLASSSFPEVAIAANRLARVVQAMPELNALAASPDCHAAFGATFRQILVAPPSEAAKLRLDHIRYMTQGTESVARQAIRAIKRSAWAVKHRHPSLYALESEWIDELLAFQSISSAQDEASDTVLGLGLLVLAGLMIAAVGWIARHLLL